MSEISPASAAEDGARPATKASGFWPALRASVELFEAMVPDDLWGSPGTWVQVLGDDHPAVLAVNKRQIQTASCLLFALRDGLFATAPVYGLDMLGNPLIFWAPLDEIGAQQTFQQSVQAYTWQAAPTDLSVKPHAQLLYEEASKKALLGLARVIDALRREGPANPMWPPGFNAGTAPTSEDATTGAEPPVATVDTAGDSAVELRVQMLADATQGDVDTRRVLSRRRILPPEVVAVLVEDADLEVRRNIAGSAFLKGDVAQRFAKDPDAVIRARAAWHRELPADLLRDLAQDDDPSVRLGVLGRFESWPGVHRTPIPAEVLVQLADDPAPIVRYAVAACPESPEGLLLRLAQDLEALPPAWQIRPLGVRTPVLVAAGVTANDSAPLSALRAAAQHLTQQRWVDGASSVVSTLVANPHTPLDALEVLHGRLIPWKVPRPILRALRTRLADECRDPDLLREILEAVADRDDDNEVRITLIANPALPREALVPLAADEDFSVREALAQCPRTPPGVLWAMLGPEGLAGLDESHLAWLETAREDLDVALASNPAAPTDLLDLLARNLSPEVRQAVGRNPNTSAATRASLRSDENPDVRATAEGEGDRNT